MLKCAIAYAFFISLCGSIYGLIPHPVSFELLGEAVKIPLQVDKITSNVPHCDILKEALRRCLSSLRLRQPVRKLEVSKCSLWSQIIVTVSSGCDESTRKEMPSEGADESYSVMVADGLVNITSAEVWGALHAFSTVQQLAFTDETKGDAMAFVKMNVLHWHIVDDSSFPFQSDYFPNLSAKGAYDPISAVYTSEDVNQIIEYSRLRGIRVMPEFDTPGHTQSWGFGAPNLLTKCYANAKPSEDYGPVDPSKNETFEFLRTLFAEVINKFPESHIHLGGDEVDFNCWKSNPQISKFMKEMNFGSNYGRLENYYIGRLLDLIHSMKQNSKQVLPVVWQEVFTNEATLDKRVTIHVWIDFLWPELLKQITTAGHTALFSACWYLNIISYGEDWPRYYTCDPGNFSTNETLLARLKGGSAAMWGEYVDDSNLNSRSWPRGAAVAERLWSPREYRNVSMFRPRLGEIRCRLRELGVPAEPAIGVDFCRVN